MEYLLPLGIFFISGLALTFSADVPGQLVDFFSRTTQAHSSSGLLTVTGFGQLPANESMPGGSTSSGGSGNVGVNNSVPPPGVGQQQVCFSSGLCVNLPTDAALLETAGSLGCQEGHGSGGSGDCSGPPDVTGINLLGGAIGMILGQLEDAGADPGLTQMLSDIQTKIQEISQTLANGGDATMLGQQLNALINQLNQYIRNNPGVASGFPEISGLMSYVANIMNGLLNNTYTAGGSPCTSLGYGCTMGS